MFGNNNIYETYIRNYLRILKSNLDGECKMSYDRITIEISGVCNAKCMWCHTGRKNRYNDKKRDDGNKSICFMSKKKFRAGLDKLINNGILSDKAEVELYNWGEPLLNPELDGILEILEERNMPFHISTNCSKLDYFSGNHLKNLTLFMISLSGFSQNTYGKIHGFDFESILKNIDKVALILKDNNLLHVMEINFHVYKFNIHELPAAKKYFEMRGIRFVPRLAYFNDYFLFEDYLNNRMNKRLRNMAEKHLMTEMLVNESKKSKKNFACPQKRKIVVDENWRLVPCCRLTSDEQIGDILEMSLAEIENTRNSISYCEPCIASGQCFTVHQELKFNYGIVESTADLNFAPKLLVDYSGMGFYWFSSFSGININKDGVFDHTYKFPTSPKALRLIIPFAYDNMMISDVSAVSEKGECKVIPLSKCTEEIKDLYKKRRVEYDIIINGNDIKEINISFNISLLSESFFEKLKNN